MREESASHAGGRRFESCTAHHAHDTDGDGPLLSALGAREVAPDLWRWTAFHPEWKQPVGCVALAAAGGLVLVDPLIPDDPAAWAALDDAIEAGGGAEIVLTVYWHDRSAAAIVARHAGTPVRAEAGSAARLGALVTHPFEAGDALPGGLVAHPTPREGEVVLQSDATLVAGDVLLGDDAGGALRLCPASWLPDGVTQADLAAALEPLLDRPLEHVLVAHGEPIQTEAPAALRGALAAGRQET